MLVAPNARVEPQPLGSFRNDRSRGDLDLFFRLIRAKQAAAASYRKTLRFDSIDRGGHDTKDPL